VILSLNARRRKKSFFVYISSPSRQPQRTTEWRNSPNAYLKQEIEETGTPNPKKVTKVNSNFILIQHILMRSIPDSSRLSFFLSYPEYSTTGQ
jgi:hypothetical protein